MSKLCLHLHRIRSIRDYLTQRATELLVHSLVISPLDYGNGLLYDVLDQLLDKLQSVQNVAARILVRASRYDHITSILETLHWLRVRYRIEWKVVLMTFKVLHLLAHSYIADLLQFYQPYRTLRSSSNSLLTVRWTQLFATKNTCCLFAVASFCLVRQCLLTDLYRSIVRMVPWYGYWWHFMEYHGIP